MSLRIDFALKSVGRPEIHVPLKVRRPASYHIVPTIGLRVIVPGNAVHLLWLFSPYARDLFSSLFIHVFTALCLSCAFRAKGRTCMSVVVFQTDKTGEMK